MIHSVGRLYLSRWGTWMASMIHLSTAPLLVPQQCYHSYHIHFKKSHHKKMHKSPWLHKLFTALTFHLNCTAVCGIWQLLPKDFTSFVSDQWVKSRSGKSAFFTGLTRSAKVFSQLQWYQVDERRCAQLNFVGEFGPMYLKITFLKLSISTLR